MTKSSRPKEHDGHSMKSSLKIFIKLLKYKSYQENLKVISTNDFIDRILFFMVHFMRTAKCHQCMLFFHHLTKNHRPGLYYEFCVVYSNQYMERGT